MRSHRSSEHRMQAPPSVLPSAPSRIESHDGGSQEGGPATAPDATAVSASHASSRGPLKLSTRRMQQDADTTEPPAFRPSLHAGGSGGGRGFLSALQSTMPRELAMITGTRRGPALPGVAEEVPAAASPKAAAARRNWQAAALAAGQAATEAAMAPVAQPAAAAPAGKPQRALDKKFSFFQYFVGRPSMAPAAAAEPAADVAAVEGFSTPPMKPRSEPPKQKQEHHAVPSASPPYYKPALLMSDPPPPAQHRERSDSQQPHAAMLPPYAPPAQPVRGPSWPHERHTSSTSAAPGVSGFGGYPQHLPPSLPAAARSAAMHARHQTTVDMVQRSREALHAAQMATPEQARAVLHRMRATMMRPAPPGTLVGK